MSNSHLTVCSQTDSLLQRLICSSVPQGWAEVAALGQVFCRSVAKMATEVQQFAFAISVPEHLLCPSKASAAA